MGGSSEILIVGPVQALKMGRSSEIPNLRAVLGLKMGHNGAGNGGEFG